MSTGEHKQLISGLVDEVWNQHHAAAIDRYFGPGLREEVLEHYQQLLGAFPDLQVTIEDDLIAEGDLVVARLTLTGTHTAPFAGQTGRGSVSAGRQSGSTASPTTRSSRPGHAGPPRAPETRALPQREPVNWAGGRRAGDGSGRS